MARVITKIIGIYKITSPSNCIYIGQSIDILHRFYKYKLLSGGLKKQTRLYYSLKKHGWESHSFEIIKECNISELNSLEIFYIKKYNSFNNRYGLNLTSGGGSFTVSDSTKCKISIALRNRSKETRDKISLSQMGNKNMLGKRHSQETIEKIRRKKLNTKASEKTKTKISEKRKGFVFSKQSCLKMSENNYNRRKIKNKITGVIYQGVKEAAIDNNINRTTLTAMLVGQNPNKTNLIYESNNI